MTDAYAPFDPPAETTSDPLLEEKRATRRKGTTFHYIVGGLTLAVLSIALTIPLVAPSMVRLTFEILIPVSLLLIVAQLAGLRRARRSAEASNDFLLAGLHEGTPSPEAPATLYAPPPEPSGQGGFRNP